MDKLKHLKNQYGIYVLIYFIICSFILFFTISPFKPAFLGLTFGSLISYLNFIDLSNTLVRATLKPPAQARVYVAIRYAIRYILTGVVVFVSIKSPNINLIGTVLGLLSIKLVIFARSIKK